VPIPRKRATGFTLTELVVVIVIATILSAFAISRINTTSFNTEGYSKQVAAALRYAQKIAVSQRRNVKVTVSAGSVALTYPDIGSAVRQPPGTDAFTVNVPSGVTLGGTLAASDFTFSALGRPSTGGTLIVSGGDITPVTLTVETETGYVH
jgi:MSHA pilin protein MshC